MDLLEGQLQILIITQIPRVEQAGHKNAKKHEKIDFFEYSAIQIQKFKVPSLNIIFFCGLPEGQLQILIITQIPSGAKFRLGRSQKCKK